MKADANRQKGIEGEKGLPPQATTRAINEYLAVLDDAAFRAATEIVPKFISLADPGRTLDRRGNRTGFVSFPFLIIARFTSFQAHAVAHERIGFIFKHLLWGILNGEGGGCR